MIGNHSYTLSSLITGNGLTFYKNIPQQMTVNVIKDTKLNNSKRH